jgi:hypothetical protein
MAGRQKLVKKRPIDQIRSISEPSPRTTAIIDRSQAQKSSPAEARAQRLVVAI